MIGQTVSHYKILEKAGEGGMGLVYKALDLRLERFAALKFLPLNCRPQEKARFLREAKAASAIDHPNVCTIYDVGEMPDGRLFIAMAYYEGSELTARTKNGPMALEHALDIAIQISEGLRAAHERGIVHRDIKSSNILVCNGRNLLPGRVKIIDFGLAQYCRTADNIYEDSGSGTLAYMSPEQLRGEAVDQRTDIWSLGVVLYEMLTGRLPFASIYREAMTYLILNEDPPLLSHLRPEISLRTERIVTTCLEKDALLRYRQADSLLEDLRRERVGFGYHNVTRSYDGANAPYSFS